MYFLCVEYVSVHVCGGGDNRGTNFIRENDKIHICLARTPHGISFIKAIV